MKKFTHTLLLVLITSMAYSQAFITTWKTDNPGASNDNQITIPTNGGGPDFNYSVDWGDGSSDTGVTGDITHTYDNPGTYSVSITGDFPAIFFNNDGDKDKILTIEQWGTIQWTTMRRAFMGCSNLNINASDAPNLSNVTTLQDMFQFASSLNADFNHWDVSNILNMSQTFANATNFNGNITSWDVSNVTEMVGTFAEATSFNQPIGSWNTGKVTRMIAMFKESNFNQDISNWDVGMVASFSQMFRDNPEFNQNIGSWDVAMATDMSFMFEGASAFDQPIGGWDVSKVTDMTSMFETASAFNADISDWNLIEVLETNRMFLSAGAFNQDISDWNVSKVVDMNDMFNRAISFSADISAWDVSQVTTMSGMFFRATSFDQNLASWDVSKVTNMAEMFDESGLSTTNYDNTLNGWSQLVLQANVTFGAANTSYCNGAAARQAIINDFNWTLADAGESCRPFITTWETTDQQITIPTTGPGYNYDISWFNETNPGVQEGTLSAQAGDAVLTNLENNSTYRVEISGVFPRIYFNNSGDRQKLMTIEQWGDISWTSMNRAFYGCVNMTMPATDAPNLSDVTSMFRTFSNCEVFNGNISRWDVSNVTNFFATFSDATVFNQDIGQWNTSSANTMRSMFDDARAFNQNISNWDVSNVSNFNSMFFRAYDFNSPLNNWDMSSATDMTSMFFSATSFNQPIGNWEFPMLISLDNLFRNAQAFNQDLSDWEVGNINDMGQLFWLASSFNQDLSSWDVSAVTDMTNIFSDTDLSIANYDKILVGWSQLTLQPNVPFGASGAEYCLGAAARDVLINAPNNWTITDAGENCIVNIPDANFKQALIDLGIDDNPTDGEISFDEAAVVNNLQLTSKSISDLTGIEAFTALVTLNITNNSVSSLDVSNIATLKNLHVQNNNLNNVDVSNNTELESLRLGNNNLESVDLSTNTKLFDLLLFNTGISSVDLSNNTLITILNVSSNPNLTNVDLSALGDLQTFRGSGTGVSSYDFTNNPLLFNIEVKVTDITSFDFSQNPNLGIVNISNNELTSLDLSNNPNVTLVWAEGNHITDLDLSANGSLENLDIDNNELQSINLQNGNNVAITAFSATGNQNLTCILVDDINHFTNNFADGIDEGARFSTDCGPIVNIPDANFKAALLADIDINTVDDGEITVAEAEAFTERLNVTTKGIADLTGVEAFVNITELTASNNQLTTINLSQNTKLTLVWATHNDLESIDVSELELLENLALSSNQLDEIDLSANTELVFLELNDNLLSNVDLSNNLNLRRLAINDNAFVTLDISDLDMLTDIRVANNELTSLNIKNANNTIVTRFEATGNPNLTCVKVDDVDHFINNFSDQIDAGASYGTTCPDAQTISFDPIDNKFTTDSPFEIVASASSGLDIMFTIDGPASLAGTTVTLDGTVGIVTIIANQAGNDDYSPAPEVVRSFEVLKQSQTITLTEIADKLTTDAPFEVSATASSGLAVDLSITGPATIEGTTITLDGTEGTVTITANQAGNDDYSPAPEVVRSFEVLKQSQTITLTEIADKLTTDAPFEVSATASSGLAVDLSITGPATIEGTTITLDGTEGTVTITANQAGNEDFNPAEEVSASFEVAAPEKEEQAITFNAIEDQFLEEGQITLSATTTSGLEVVYEVVSGPASVTDNVVVFNDLGIVTIKATQPGDDEFLPATPVEQTFEVIAVTGLEGGVGAVAISVFPNPAQNYLNITVATDEKVEVSLITLNGSSIMRLDSHEMQLDISHLERGMYFLRVVSADKTYTHKIFKN